MLILELYRARMAVVRFLPFAPAREGAMEVWQWLVVLVFVCVLLWLLVQYLRQRAASDFPNTPLKGIGGCLACSRSSFALALLEELWNLCRACRTISPDWRIRRRMVHSLLSA